ncbi:MAG: MalY/PatB family protein [Desertimonas sp.]
MSDDRFGLRAVTIESARARRGVKWGKAQGRLAAWVADMDFPIAPAIRDRIIDVAGNDVGYAHWPHPGRSFLPDLFVERMTARYRWAPPVDQLVELADVMQGVQMALHHLTDPGDGVVLHVPAYHPFLNSIASTGRRRVDVPAVRSAAGWVFDHDELDRRLAREPARMLLLCHPHNPVGHVFDRAELERIADLAIRHDLWVISDEIHGDLVHPGHQHVPFASLGPEVAARTVTVTSSSKAFNMAGLRWAIMHVGAPALRDALAALPNHYFGAPNLLAVEATGAAWTAGAGWQEAVGAQLDENRRLLARLLDEHLPGVDFVIPDATYLGWLDLRPLGWEGDRHEQLRARGVELSPGSQFGPGGDGFARLNFATSPTVLTAIVEAMATPPA